MSEWVYIDHLKDHFGETVTLKGWLYNKRSSGKIHFLQIRDGTGFVQCVAVRGEIPDDAFESYNDLTQESSVIVEGEVREDKRAPSGVEIGLKSLELVQKAEEYPISPKDHTIGYLLPRRHLWLRSKKQHALIRLRVEIERAIDDYFESQGFLRIDPPILTPASVEGTTTLFGIDYFGENAYLSQSGQLYMEAACMAHGKVYCFAPSFRAEKSKTRRHLIEFWQIEPEVAYADLNDAMDLAEDLISYLVERALENRKEELEILERDVSKLENIKKPFPRVPYHEAAKILADKGMKFEVGDDFGGDEETVISENFDRPVLVHRYPAKIKPFYMKRDPENYDLALCVDMLAPEGYGEIVGGSQREDDLDELLKRIEEHKLPREAFEWYVDLRRYGTVPHAGFGLGLERTVGWIAGIHHIREAIPFPRLLEKIYP
jgi:asparaginyl-tRNA synthetase